MHDLWFWFIAVELLGLAALPLVGAAFGHLPDRGWALAKPLTLLLLGVAVWLPLVLFPALPYSRGWVVLVVLLLVAGNATAVVVRPGLGLRWLAWLRGHWRYAATCEALFAGGMWAMGSLRALNPGAIGTEKFMDQAFLAAIMRAPHLPPPDPWLSGYTINYYYFGHFLLANVAKLLDTSAPVAFNVGIALTAGLAAIAFFGVAANMTAVVLVARRRTVAAESPLSERAASQLGRAAPFALFTVLAALVIGNLRSIAMWWDAMAQVAKPQHITTLSTAWNWLGHPALWSSYDYWSPSRAIPNTITEFPSFSFLLADLHAHVLALPYAILAVGVALHLWLSPARRGFALFGEGWGAVPTLLASGLSLGALYLINGWDLPTYLALALLVLAVHQWGAHGRALSGEFFLGLAQAGLALLAVCFIPYLPFYAHFISPSQGIGFVPGATDHLAFPLAAVTPTMPGDPASRTAIIDELGANGLLLIVFGTWLVVLLARRLAAGLAAASLADQPREAEDALYAEHPRGAPNDSYLAYSAALAGATASVRRESGGPTVTIDAITGNIAPPDDVIMVGSEPPLRSAAPTSSPDLHPMAWGQAWVLIGAPVAALGVLTWRFAQWDAWVWIWGALFLVAALWLALEPFAARGEADAQATAKCFPLLLVAVGAGLIVLCEFVFLRDVFAGSLPRMNTIFKSYFQVWALFALASAPALAWLWLHLPERLPGLHMRPWQPLAWAGRGLAVAVLLALVALSCVYPLGASHALYPLGQRNGPTSLSGLVPTATIDKGIITQGDVTAITWLAGHATPDAVLVEGIDPNTEEYSLYGRVSTFTGIPAIIGWYGHEDQWRVHWLDDPANAADMHARQGDLRTIYTSHAPTVVLGLLHHYHVRYVYVGAAEQQLYSAANDLTSFGGYLTTIYHADGVTIYQVPGI